MNTQPAWRVGLVGECMIELQATPEGHVTRTFGGDTLNTAVYLARLGADFGVQVDYISAVGDEGFSEAMLNFWKAEGVGVSLTRRLPGRLPGLYFIELEPDGERVFSYWRGEAAARDCFAVPGAESLLAQLADFDALYLSGISLGILREDGRRRLLDRLTELRQSGPRLIFDGNFRPRLWGANEEEAVRNARPWYREMAALSHVLLLTAEEAPVFGSEFAAQTSAAQTDTAARLAALGPEEVLIKNGPGACLVYSQGTSCTVAAQCLETVVDTTAAGDSFSATYLLGRHLGLDMQGAVQRAHHMAARVISYRGAIIPREAMPALFNNGQ